ncbi:uncharacterized protein GGS22DRAFT_77746 [Annulohypoxylon maeteangense]|uniref:uncharacterized protein n=1 Tax=Annulohypoxylon maeteangense TaxID=1927788 RepID=UPI0020084B3B|nr:uncharacterized protein GGS22DRAFT_77746 [Annulohypoxylon maeteangense]KAI0880885.1 hypothetical protein GGS22DRAFT_77746 [Annulohypoxylon maeteangense]
MCSITVLAILLAPLGVFASSDSPNPPSGTMALPSVEPPNMVHDAVETIATPQPCAFINPLPSEEETRTRFDQFANAFMVKHNLTEAFEYVSSIYINHSPLSPGDGPDIALSTLSTFWDHIQITPLHQKFEGNMGWINYNAMPKGVITDRFRWEAGCIVEHWDEDQFPNK